MMNVSAPQRQYGSTAATTQQPLPEHSWSVWYDDPIVVFTLVLAIATIVLGVSTTALWLTTKRVATNTKEAGDVQADKMERSVAEASKSAEAMQGVAAAMAVNAAQIVKSVSLQQQFGQMQLRPYVTVLVGAGKWQDANHYFEISPKVLNTGHTPAKDVRWRLAMDAVKIAEFDKFRFPLPAESVGGNMIAAHQDYILSTALPYKVAEEEIDPLRFGTGERALLVWGYISYRDGLRRRYLTTFAHRFWWQPTFDNEGKITGMLPRGLYLYRHNLTS